MAAHGLGSEAHRNVVATARPTVRARISWASLTRLWDASFTRIFQAEKPESQRIPLSSLSQPVNPAVPLNETVLLFIILPCGLWNKSHLSGSTAS